MKSFFLDLKYFFNKSYIVLKKCVFLHPHSEME